jgi:hypothetical protein
VSRIGNPQAPADCQSAKQQITNLRCNKNIASLKTRRATGA